MAYDAPAMTPSPLLIPRPELERTLLDELQRTPLLALVGPRGAGKTTVLGQLGRHWRGATAFAQLDPIACTPEVLHDELRRLAESVLDSTTRKGRGKSPLKSLCAALRKRRADSLLLLDDVTEVRTLASYPDVDRPLESVLEALAGANQPCVVSSRFGYWMQRHFPELPLQWVPPLTVEELSAAGVADAELVVAATGGIAVYVSRLVDRGDVEAALADELRSGGRIEAECRATMAELLHRARGYGACKSVLRVLAEEQGLNLTEVSRRLDRTPGSTRDYLRWLEEVDLLVVREKRYFFIDGILRLWVRIDWQGTPPSEEDVRREVEAHLGTRGGERVVEPFTFPVARSENLVEID